MNDHFTGLSVWALVILFGGIIAYAAAIRIADPSYIYGG